MRIGLLLSCDPNKNSVIAGKTLEPRRQQGNFSVSSPRLNFQDIAHPYMERLYEPSDGHLILTLGPNYRRKVLDAGSVWNDFYQAKD